MVEIKAQGLLPVEVTPEHPLLVTNPILQSNGKIIGFTEPEWKEAKDISIKLEGEIGDYLVSPILKRNSKVSELDLSTFTNVHGQNVTRGRGYPIKLPLTTATAWLMGIYVAEGWASPSKGHVVFAFDRKETEFQDRVLEIAKSLGYSPRRVQEKTATKCFISSFLLARSFKHWFGHGADRKKIPDFLMLHEDNEILRAFLKGWEDGDGYWRSEEGGETRLHFSGATISRTLGLQLQLLYMSLGICANLSRRKTKASGYTCGRKVSLCDLYLIDYSLTGSKQTYSKFYAEFFLHPVRKKTFSKYVGNVHNIETTDNTYLVSNAVVHNCVREALNLLEKGQNVPHYGRFLMASYLLAVGKTVDDIMALFPKAPDFKASVTKYQVEHIAGLKGGRTRYSVPSCKTLQTHSFCFKDPVKCYEILTPLQYPSRKRPENTAAKSGKTKGDGGEGGNRANKKANGKGVKKTEERRGWTKVR
jgi:Eukaryotic and archaeal DNA primase, large subunit/LAGLIDADG-like domain